MTSITESYPHSRVAMDHLLFAAEQYAAAQATAAAAAQYYASAAMNAAAGNQFDNPN